MEIAACLKAGNRLLDRFLYRRCALVRLVNQAWRPHNNRASSTIEPRGIVPCGISIDEDLFGRLVRVPNPRQEMPFIEGALERIAGI